MHKPVPYYNTEKKNDALSANKPKSRGWPPSGTGRRQFSSGAFGRVTSPRLAALAEKTYRAVLSLKAPNLRPAPSLKCSASTATFSTLPYNLPHGRLFLPNYSALSLAREKNKTKANCAILKINQRLAYQGEKLGLAKTLPLPWGQRPASPLGALSFQRKRLYKKIHIATVTILSSRNNTLLTLSRGRGQLLRGGWASAGSSGFRNSRKSTTYAAQGAAKSLALRARQLGIRALYLKVQGTGRAKGAVVRTLQQSFLRVLLIRDCTATVHNGCRRPKSRRI